MPPTDSHPLGMRAVVVLDERVADVPCVRLGGAPVVVVAGAQVLHKHFVAYHRVASAPAVVVVPPGAQAPGAKTRALLVVFVRPEEVAVVEHPQPAVVDHRTVDKGRPRGQDRLGYWELLEARFALRHYHPRRLRATVAVPLRICIGLELVVKGGRNGCAFACSCRRVKVVENIVREAHTLHPVGPSRRTHIHNEPAVVGPEPRR